jgi:hypothetical protein
MKKVFISGACTYGPRGKELRSHSSDKTLIPEGIVKRRRIMPSLRFDLVSMSDTADGAGGQYASNEREGNRVEGVKTTYLSTKIPTSRPWSTT